MKVLEGFKKGINLGGWFSQCDYSEDTFDNFIVEDDFKVISSWGVDHVRLPIDYNLVEDEAGNYKEEGFEYIRRAIDWARKYNLNVVLDLHKTFGYSFDAGEKQEGFFEREDYQERFYRLWNQLSKRYCVYGDKVAFELLNEVTDINYMPVWNKVWKKCLAVIRKNAPKTKVLIGGYWNNSVLSVKDIDYVEDENVVYNFHCYDPLIFTHQGAYWMAEMKTDFRMDFRGTLNEYIKIASDNNMYAQVEQLQEQAKVSAPDRIIDYRYFEDIFAEAIKKAKEDDKAIYCGEYGVIDLVDPESTLEWYREINKAFEKHNIGRSAWSYKRMDFGISDERLNGVRDELLSML